MQRRIVGSSLTWSAVEELDIANVILLLLSFRTLLSGCRDFMHVDTTFF